MPHIDFAQIFAPRAETKSSPVESAPLNQGIRASASGYRRLQTSLTSRLSRFGWTNVTFTTVTFLGGLICVFYFFNGAELLRLAAGWPGEFLYSRPFSAEQNGKIAKSDGGDEPNAPFARNSDTPSRQGPFGRNAGLAAFNQGPPVASPISSLVPPTLGSPTTPPGGVNPGGPSGPGGPVNPPGVPPSPPPFGNPGSLLGRLNTLIPGADALSQAFNQAVAALARARELDARRTIVVVETVVAQPRQRATKTVKNAARNARNTVTNLSGKPLGQASSQNSTLATTTQNVSGTTQNAAAATHNTAATTRNTVSANQNQVTGAVLSTGSSTVRSVSNPGQRTISGLSGLASRSMSGLGSARGRTGLGGGRRR